MYVCIYMYVCMYIYIYIYINNNILVVAAVRRIREEHVEARHRACGHVGVEVLPPVDRAVETEVGQDAARAAAAEVGVVDAQALLGSQKSSVFKEGSFKGGDHAKNEDGKRQESREHRTAPCFGISPKTTLVLSLTSIDSRSPRQPPGQRGGRRSRRQPEWRPRPDGRAALIIMIIMIIIIIIAIIII